VAPNGPDRLRAALDLLRDLTKEGIATGDARDRLEEFRDAIDDPSVDLVWHVDPLDDSIAYCVLLRDDDGVVVSLGRARGGMPWALRGVHRWSEEDLVRINGRVVKVEEAIAFLELDAPSLKVVDRIADSFLLQEEIAKRSREVDAASLQTELDLIRRRLGLATASDTRAWLEARHMTHPDLERQARDQILLRRLQEQVIRPEAVGAHFAQNASSFSVATMHWIWRHTREEATSALGELTAGRPIEQLALDLGNDEGHAQLPLAVRRHRHDLPDAFGRLFEPDAPSPFGPIAYRDGFVLGYRVDLAPAKLTSDLEATIRGKLFGEWLSVRRTSADIEWLWGPADPVTT
jgi:putative peptide maturation system protein